MQEQYIFIDERGDKHYYKDKDMRILHRLDGPAIERAKGSKEWYVDDKLHRLDGPAIEYADGSKEWCVAGKLHRLDGPALESACGQRIEWWVSGKELTEKQFNAMINEQLLKRAEAAEEKAYLAEDALREIALFLSCGGYNDVGLVPFDPAQYAKKIKDAIIMQQRSDRGETNPCIGQWVTSAHRIRGSMEPRAVEHQ